MRRSVFCLLLLASCGAVRAEAAAGPRPRSGVQLATVCNGRVYTAIDASTFMRGNLVLLPVVAHIFDFNVILREAPPRWRLAGGVLHKIDFDYQPLIPRGVRDQRFTHYSWEVNDMIYFGRPLRQPRAALGPPQERYRFSFPTIYPDEPLLTMMFKRIRDDVNERRKVRNDKFPYHHYEFYYDLLPDGPRADKAPPFKLFVLANGRLQRAIEKCRAEEALKPLPKDPDERVAVYDPYDKLGKAAIDPLDGAFLGVWSIDGRRQWALVEQIQPPFSERFQVFAQGTTWFFVTDSGKVYAGKKPAKGKARKLEPWWSDPVRPIIAVVQDTETGRTFLFARAARKADKDFYVELGERPVPRPFVPADLKAVVTLDPLKTMMQYAGLLVADKKIALPKKAKK